MKPGCCRALSMLLLALLAPLAEAGAADPGADPAERAALAPGLPDLRQVSRHDQLLLQSLAAPGAGRRRRKQSLDLSPLAEWAIAAARGMGVPLIERRDRKGGAIAVSAGFALAYDMPEFRLHLGDRATEPFGAFFPSRKGIRCSLIYPLRDFTLRVEAGGHSEFGNIAIAGVQWVHPSQRVAVGLGMPTKLDNSDSIVGAVFQIRVKLK